MNTWHKFYQTLHSEAERLRAMLNECDVEKKTQPVAAGQGVGKNGRPQTVAAVQGQGEKTK